MGHQAQQDHELMLNPNFSVKPCIFVPYLTQLLMLWLIPKIMQFSVHFALFLCLLPSCVVGVWCRFHEAPFPVSFRQNLFSNNPCLWRTKYMYLTGRELRQGVTRRQCDAYHGEQVQRLSGGVEGQVPEGRQLRHLGDG